MYGEKQYIENMITIEKADILIRSELPERRIEEVNVETAERRVLARRVLALEDSPRFTNSSMDGFAFNYSEVENRNFPLNLTVVGESQAGVPFTGTLKAGEAIRVSTGAMLPAECDCVVPFEETEADADTIIIKNLPERLKYVRLKGESVKKGDEILSPGEKLTPVSISLLVSQGIEKVKVFARPKVAILSTGTELAESGIVLKPFQTRESNAVFLEKAIEELGGIVVARKRIPDDPKQTKEAIYNAGEVADLVITSGGISEGIHDHVREASKEAGFRPLFHEVAQKPGKPLYVGKKKDTFHFGLPGNPVATVMTFYHYAAPVIRYLKGEGYTRNILSAVLTENVGANGKRKDIFYRVTIRQNNAGEFLAVPQKKTGSHNLAFLAKSNGYVVVEKGKQYLKGEKITVYLF